jgi:hypothetical protein
MKHSLALKEIMEKFNNQIQLLLGIITLGSFFYSYSVKLMIENQRLKVEKKINDQDDTIRDEMRLTFKDHEKHFILIEYKLERLLARCRGDTNSC